MSRREKDARNAKRYMAAYRRKMGKPVAETAEAVCEEYETARPWLARCHKERACRAFRGAGTGAGAGR